MNATSSVFYNVAFLNQIKSGPTFKAFHALIKRPIFSYGSSSHKKQQSSMATKAEHQQQGERLRVMRISFCQSARRANLTTLQISLLAGWLSELHLASRSSRCSSSATHWKKSVTSGPSRSCQL